MALGRQGAPAQIRLISGEMSERREPGIGRGPGSMTDPIVACRRALALCLRLEGILRANLEEIAALTLLRRPVARLRFRQGTGLRAEDWLAEAAEMSRRLDRAIAAGGAYSAILGRGTLPAFAARLRRLAAFDRQQEANAPRRFIDAETRDRALEALVERRQTTTELADALEELVRLTVHRPGQ